MRPNSLLELIIVRALLAAGERADNEIWSEEIVGLPTATCFHGLGDAFRIPKDTSLMLALRSENFALPMDSKCARPASCDRLALLNVLSWKWARLSVQRHGACRDNLTPSG